MSYILIFWSWNDTQNSTWNDTQNLALNVAYFQEKQGIEWEKKIALMHFVNKGKFDNNVDFMNSTQVQNNSELL